jgi:hypothetical protein
MSALPLLAEQRGVDVPGMKKQLVSPLLIMFQSSAWPGPSKVDTRGRPLC